MTKREIIDLFKNEIFPLQAETLFLRNYQGLGELDRDEYLRDSGVLIELAEAGLKNQTESAKTVFYEFREKLSKWMFHNSESVRGDNMIDIDYLEGHMDELMWELGIESLPEDSNE